MISTLVDSNILIDILNEHAPPVHQAWSSAQLMAAAVEGTACISVIVWAEISQPYGREDELRSLLWRLNLREEPLPFAAAFPAGQAQRLYRERGGRRERTLPDFLIGAHALVAGHRLLTRDPARYAEYFPDIEIISPETHP